MSDEWFSPARLEAQSRDSNRENAGGDFGSYAAVLRTGRIVGTALESHNLVRAAERVRQYRCVLPRRHYASIADIGCGLGFTAAALAQEFTGAHVFGYEISEDAVLYGQKTFPDVVFRRQGIDPQSDLGERFDLVLAQEFYPFTRTADWAIQKPLIDMIFRHLKPGGILLIELSERGREGTVLANRDLIAGVRAERLAFDRIYRKLKVFWLARIASGVAGPLRGVDRNIALILEKPRDSVVS
jgi:SAM-dependent methyltransferase